MAAQLSRLCKCNAAYDLEMAVHRTLAHSFVHSLQGGSFAVMTFENSLNVTAGSNFVADDKMVPVYNSMPNGPFLLHPERSVPKVILVKTHCAGYCVDCHVNDRSMMLSFTDFEKTCRRTFPPTGGSSNKDDSEFYYPNTLVSTGKPRCRDALTGHIRMCVLTHRSNVLQPSKIIHWYRDLSGVLIARKHKGLKKILAQNETTVNGTIIIRDTREGFLEWCKHIDSRFNIDEASFPESIHQSLFKQVPCSSDVYRWVKWHNHATELRDRIGVDTVKLYFEDFAEKWHDWGTKTLLGFLNGKHDVIRQRRTPPTDPARRYKSLYTKDETKALTKLVYALSSPECWADISLYFDEQLIQEDEKPGGLPARLPRRDDLPVRLAWLLSFPNSGTSYTMTNTEFLTNHSVLTNYPEEAKGPQLDLGLPFVLHLGLERPDVFLTKSHCNPKDDFYRFEKGCRTVRTNVNGTQTDSMYPSRAVSRD